MAKLSFNRKIETVTVVDISNTNYYHPYTFDMEPWEKLKTILSRFGVILSSPYEVEFADKVVYKGRVIAEGKVDGSNFCDQVGKLTIYMDILESIYEIK